MLTILLALIAWGWLNQQWLVTGIILLLIVGHFPGTLRWHLTVAQFYRIGDFVSAIFVAVLIYFALVPTEQRPVFMILEWLPVFFLPLLLAQLYSVNNQLPLGTLFYSQRKRERQTTLDFKLPYAAICCLAAGAANDPGLAYLMLSIACFSAILWSVRSQNSSLILWFVVIALAAGISYQGQQSLRHFHAMLEEHAVEWFTDWPSDPFKSTTSIGDLGNLKLSDRIEFRVRGEGPLLLMQASYDRYLGKSWLATLRVFSAKPNFSIQDNQVQIKHLEIFQSAKQTTILALPAGTVGIQGLDGATLLYSPLGAVKLTEAPDFVNYRIDFTGRHVDKVREFDLQIPAQHQAWITAIKQDLKLEQQTPGAIAEAIQQYFKDNYYYSLFLGKEADPDKALADFILHRKAGHCEYFAVASVFLLRSYGIPARLANGYAMQEFNEAEQMYIVRRRHAHAWASAHIDGAWQAVDATPAQWLEMEEQQSGLLQPVYDFFSRLYFHFKQWRYQQVQADERIDGLPIWQSFSVLLFVLLAWRLFISRRNLVQINTKGNPALPYEYSGQDSELFVLEKALAKTADARLPNESVAVWAKRLDNQELIAIIKLHYRYRFASGQFTKVDRKSLKHAVARWLALYH